MLINNFYFLYIDLSWKRMIDIYTHIRRSQDWKRSDIEKRRKTQQLQQQTTDVKWLSSKQCFVDKLYGSLGKSNTALGHVHNNKEIFWKENFVSVLDPGNFQQSVMNSMLLVFSSIISPFCGNALQWDLEVLPDKPVIWGPAYEWARQITGNSISAVAMVKL